MSINFTVNTLILTKENYDNEDLNERDEKLTLTSLKYLVRKNKNQSRLKKILRESYKNHYGLK